MGRGFHKSKSPGTGRNHTRGVGGTHNHRKGHKQTTKSIESFHKKRPSDHVPLTLRPPPKLPQELSGLAKFIKAPRFLGRKYGYYFAKGKDGLGYYLDHVQIGKMGDKAKARLAASSRAAATTTPSPSKVSSCPPTPNSTPVASPKVEKNNQVGNASHSLPKKRIKLIDGNDSSGGVGKIRGGKKRRSKGEVKNAAEVKHGEHEKREGSESDNDDAEEDENGQRCDNDANNARVGTEPEQKDVREPSGTRRARGSSSSSIRREHDKNDGSDSEDDDGDDQDRELAGKDIEEAEVNADYFEGEQKLNFNDGMPRGEREEGMEASDDDINDDEEGEEEEKEEETDDEEDDNIGDDEGQESPQESDERVRKRKKSKNLKSEDETEKDTRAKPQQDGGTQVDAEAKSPVDGEVTFGTLGVTGPLCEAAAQMGWTHPTEIQRQALPLAFEGKDVIGLAETGSGKTGAFAIPILQALLENPQRLFAAILAPTRELAFQINEVMEALGVAIGLRTVCIVGGIDMFQQSVALALKPHVVIATPGRLVDHLENTKGFSLRTIKFLVLDEADRMLGMDFEEEINKVLAVLPRERRTFLFSATMTSKVAKLQRASLKNPTRVEVAHKFATPKTLVQQYMFFPAKHKDCYLVYLLNEFAGQSTIVFVATCNSAQRVALLLRNLGFQAVCLHGQMGQAKRLGALAKFKSRERNVLIATDVASRGLDIPSVDLVVNMDIPAHGKDYIHRVGRTARAGRAGRSVAFVTQYDVEVYQRMEALIGQKLPAYSCDEETVLVLQERVSEAQRMATREMREAEMSRRGKRRKSGDEEGAEDTESVVRSFKRQRGGGGGGRGARGKGRRGGKGGRR